MSRLSIVWTILLVMGVLLILETAFSFILQLIFNDPTFYFPLIQILIKVVKRLFEFLYAGMYFFSTFLGVMGGVGTFDNLITAFVDAVWVKPVAVLEAFVDPLTSLATVTVEMLVVGGIIKIIESFFTFEKGGGVKDIQWKGRG